MQSDPSGRRGPPIPGRRAVNNRAGALGAMSIGQVLFWYSLAAGLLGLALLTRGLIGHRTGVDPHCRLCGYNLRARDRSRMYDRCAECGADLEAPHAIAVGRWERLGRFIYVGLAFILLSLPVPTARVFFALTGLAQPPNRPAWLLELDLKYGGEAAGVAALTEILRRADVGADDRLDYGRIAAIGLSRPPPRAKVDRDQWTRLFDIAWERGQTPREALARATLETLEPELVAFPAESGHLAVGFRYRRTGESIADSATVHESDVKVWVDGIPLAAESNPPGSFYAVSPVVFPLDRAGRFRRGTGRATGLWHAARDVQGALQPGSRVVTVEATLHIRPPNQPPISRAVRARKLITIPPVPRRSAPLPAGVAQSPRPDIGQTRAVPSSSPASLPTFGQASVSLPAFPAPAAPDESGGTGVDASDAFPKRRDPEDFYASTPFFRFQAELAERSGPPAPPPGPEVLTGPLRVDPRVFLPTLPPVDGATAPRSRREPGFADLLPPATRPARARP